MYDTWYTKQYEQYLVGVRSSTPHFFCLFSVENPRTEKASRLQMTGGSTRKVVPGITLNTNMRNANQQANKKNQKIYISDCSMLFSRRYTAAVISAADLRYYERGLGFTSDRKKPVEALDMAQHLRGALRCFLSLFDSCFLSCSHLFDFRRTGT